MSGVTKVFIAGFGGTFLAAYAGPPIVKMLPDSLKTETMAKVVNATVAGGSAAAVYYLLGATGAAK